MSSNSPDGCARSLETPEQTTFTSTRTQSLAYLNIVDEAVFRRDRHKVNAALAVFGIFEFGGGYDDFSMIRASLFAQTNYDFSNEESMSFFTSKLGKTQLDSWLACVTKDRDGPFLYAEIVDDDYAVVVFRYLNSGMDARDVILDEPIIKGGKHLSTKKFPAKIEPGSELPINIERTPQDNTIVTASVRLGNASRTASLKIPYYELVVPPPPPQVTELNQVKVPVKNREGIVIGQTRANESGLVKVVGQFSYWKKPKWINPWERESVTIRAINTDGKLVSSQHFVRPNVVVPAGCTIHVAVNDSRYEDNHTNSQNPLTAILTVKSSSGEAQLAAMS